MRSPRRLSIALCLFACALSARADVGADVGAQRQRLVAAYPDLLRAVDGQDLVWHDGTRMPFTRGHTSKSFDAWLADPDLDDIFRLPYPTGEIVAPKHNEDPGRARPASLFDKMYGDCRKGEVDKHLVTVRWLPTKANQPLRVTTVNGVDKTLSAISAELDRLPATFDKYLIPAAGTYACRVIAGTDRTSAHGQGIAIDLALKHSHYWRWSRREKAGHLTWRNEIPAEIVRIFEKHGFIWGGRWYHYDTMHFEFRPELLPGR